MTKLSKNSTKLACIALVFIFILGLTGCTKKLSEDEAISKVAELVDASYELNEIVFGEGLEYIETEESKNTRYALVKENDKYNSIYDIEVAIGKVFSQKYSQTMKKTAFEGQSGAVGGTGVPARYVENKQGFLVLKEKTVHEENIDGEKLDDGYFSIDVLKYDTSTIEIKKISRRFIEAYVTSVGGEQTILVTLILEENGWRIDSPTY